MKKNLAPLPILYNPETGQNFCPGIIGPAHDGWAKNVRVYGGKNPNSYIYEFENIGKCPFCEADLSQFPKPVKSQIADNPQKIK